MVNGPQIKRRELWIDLPEEYEGFRVQIWVNAPSKLWSALERSDDESVLRESLAKIILAHNGWLDFDGRPFPDASDPEFWEEIPTELAGVILVATQTAMGELPNSIAPKRRRSKRG